ncbi:MAG: arylesterase [Bdellovibrionota bacterium]|nr:MAG: arylesterase [Bdellovibrionota bacterium]
MNDIKIMCAEQDNKRRTGLTLLLFQVALVLLTQFARAGYAEQHTLLILGDSLTAGYGVLREEGYASRLEAIARGEGSALKVLNGGLSGDTSAGGVRRIEQWLVEDFDIFMVALGGNDALRGLSPDALRVNLRAILEHVRRVKPKVHLVVAGMRAPPNMGEEYEAAFEGVYREVAREFNAVLIPFLLEGVAAEPSLNQADGIHPNGEGHAAIARHVWESVRSIVHPTRSE